VRKALASVAVGVIALVAASAASAEPPGPAGVYTCTNGVLTLTTANKAVGSTAANFIRGSIPTGAQPNANRTGYFTCTVPTGATRLQTRNGITNQGNLDAIADSEGHLIWFASPGSTLIYPAYAAG
jgi:hypothetical protein